MIFLRTILVFGILFGQAGLRASDVVELRSSPDHPLFIDFLLPYRALEFFSAPASSASHRLITWHYENEVQSFFQILKKEGILAEMLEGSLKSWDANFLKDFVQQTSEENFSDLVSRLQLLEDLDSRQKAILTSIFNLHLLQDLQRQSDLETQRVLRNFFLEVEKSPLTIKELFKIDPSFYFERLSELEALDLTSPEMTDLDIAQKIFDLRQHEKIRRDWGSQEQKDHFLRLITQEREWGMMSDEVL